MHHRKTRRSRARDRRTTLVAVLFVLAALVLLYAAGRSEPEYPVPPPDLPAIYPAGSRFVAPDCENAYIDPTEDLCRKYHDWLMGAGYTRSPEGYYIPPLIRPREEGTLIEG